MNKYEFLNILGKSLEGEVTETIINENMTYYSSYIDSEINKGKNESEVLQQLGDPRLISKTIIDTTSLTRSSGTYTYSNENQDTREGTTNKKGFNAEFNEKNGWEIRFGNFKLNSWYGKLILIAIIIIILLVVGRIAIALLPIILPIIIVFWIISYLAGGRR